MVAQQGLRRVLHVLPCAQLGQEQVPVVAATNPLKVAAALEGMTKLAECSPMAPLEASEEALEEASLSPASRL